MVFDNISVTNNKYNMRKFSNKKSVVIMKHVLIGYQVLLGSMAAFGIIRCVIGLIQGDFDHVSIGFLQ